MKLSEMYPSSLLKAQDVIDAGGEMPLTIKEVKMAEFEGDDGGKETKPVIYFTNDKKMVCNKTNGRAIADFLGRDDSDDWAGKDIILITQEVPFGDKIVPAIRIKNLNSRDLLVQEYWRKVSEQGMTRQDGLDHLKEYGQDFKVALEKLQPF